MSAIRNILIVEDQADVRNGLKERLARVYGSPAIFEAANVAGGAALIRSLGVVHLALIDLGLPDGSGVELVKQLSIAHPQALNVVVTIYADDEHLFPAIAAGAQGYLLKDTPPDVWMRQLRQLEDGTPALSPSIARRILEYFRSPPRAPIEPKSEPRDPNAAELTPRESAVLGYIARGLRVKEVADLLGLTENTVAGYVKDIYRKLNICSRAEAALEAAKRGLV